MIFSAYGIFQIRGSYYDDHFANTGVYTYDKLRVVSQPVQGLRKNCEAG